MGYVECHSHLLPFVDDGVKTKEQALRVLHAYKDAGFSIVVTTPHLYNPLVVTHVDNIRTMYRWLEGEGKKLGIRVVLGSETFVGSASHPKNLPFLGNFVLVEVDTSVEPLYLLNYAYTLIKSGHFVILAHIERYDWFSEKSLVVKRLVEMGVFFQSNCDAVLSGTVDSYLNKRMIDIIAGDNHGDDTLPARLAASLQKHPEVLQRMERLFETE
ncbi:MAG: capsule biosynthesis protein CapC [Sphaerochaetaceae bacterium]|nr:capsule biosynthesis protein CapC [Sphaerochaetaceae bacterium]